MPSLGDLRGVTPDLVVESPSSLVASLRTFGFAPEQIDAIARRDFAIDTFVKLIDLERTCMSTAGLALTREVSISRSDGYEVPVYGIARATSSGADQSRIDHVAAQCQTHFSRLYGLFYSQAKQPSQEEQLRLQYDRMGESLDCARQAGLNPPANPTTPEELGVISDWLETVTFPDTCRQA